MAISTQTEALIDVYTQQLTLSQTQIEQSNSLLEGYTINRGPDQPEIKIWGPQEVIDNFYPAIVALDNKIVEVNSEIQDLQYQILSTGLAANAVGCGTTGNIIQVNRDDVKYKSYSYTSPNPFSETVGILTNTTLGYGVTNFVESVGIGTYLGDLITYGQCTTQQNLIVNLQNTINSKIGVRSDLINKSNILKEQRSSFELQKYAHNETITKLNAQVGICSSILQFLQDPANDEWL